ncbi:unnamed protein product [Prorocentrum cordatum]|uniref:Uncharacterized protein n=1 Tax=Prorocentrum cordatum TaxID=2364126 RepID=A0ABN9WDC3_9DINO|nr:unnamed protein product [Polarella glacialis]
MPGRSSWNTWGRRRRRGSTSTRSGRLTPLLRRAGSRGRTCLQDLRENITRDLTVYDWCGVGQGLASVTFWPGDEQSAAVTVQTASVRWVQWPSAAEVVSWQCDGANKVMSTSLPGGLAPLQWLSLQVWQENRSWDLVSAGGLAGRLKWNTWNHTDYIFSV